MPTAKSTRPHNLKKPKVALPDESAPELKPPKKPFEIEVDEIAPIIATDKIIEDDPEAIEDAPSEEEVVEDEVGLDDEEIDPFKDKWEE